jgi:AcrR family transcriptional regulator
MTPRPRETSDSEILAATMRCMSRFSPAQLTLADVAREAGVVPATLVQRFSTKRDLLLAACRSGLAGVEGQFAAARRKHRSPLKALVELLVDCSGFASTPEAMANGLAYLQNDLTDPDFRAVTLGLAVGMRRELKKLLDEAVAAGELRKCDTAKLAGLLHAVYNGSTLNWAIYRQATLSAWVRADILALLAPYKSGSKNAGR